MAQIFKEYTDAHYLGLITMKEVCLIIEKCDNKFKYNDDRANEYLAFDLPLNEEDADELVTELNAITEIEVGIWYLGDKTEEYVNVD